MGKGPSGRGLLPPARFDHKFRAGYSHGFVKEAVPGSERRPASANLRKKANNAKGMAEKTPKQSGINL